jgi:hypothetical protein
VIIFGQRRRYDSLGMPVLTNRCRILTSRGSGPPPPAAEVLNQSIEGLAGFTQLLGHQMLAIDAQPLRQPRSVATCSRQRLGDAVIGRMRGRRIDHCLRR